MQKGTSHHTAKQNPFIFGEVLFDEFEDGSSILGGAPFNVAWHLQGLGLHPTLITKVGDDANGKIILNKMNDWALPTCAVQIDNKYATGKVAIKLDQGQPTYDIVPNQAYDNINNAFDNLAEKLKNCPLLYHGSLALRNKVSRETLFNIQQKYSIPAFVDINLRSPWWDEDIIHQCLRHATWAKLNDIELIEIAKQVISVSNTDLKEIAQLLRAHFDLKLLIVTLGENGAYFISENETYFGASVPVNNIIDTVGAGDAFSSVTIFGLLNKWPIEVISQRAMTFASSICEKRGATNTDNQFYNDFLKTIS